MFHLLHADTVFDFCVFSVVVSCLAVNTSITKIATVSYTHLLVSDISHQVKTPVSNLKMATDTLLEKPMAEACLLYTSLFQSMVSPWINRSFMQHSILYNVRNT